MGRCGVCWKSDIGHVDKTVDVVGYCRKKRNESRGKKDVKNRGKSEMKTLKKIDKIKNTSKCCKTWRKGHEPCRK